MTTIANRDLLPQTGFSRRGLLLGGAALAAGAMLPRAALATNGERKRVLRVAHLTDIHVEPERNAAAGLAACLKHVQEQHDKPDLILFGGDQIMESFEQTRERTKIQWDIWARVLKAENSLPAKACIGNHDIWGWNKTKSQATGMEADFGKQWAIQALGLPKRYYSFSQAGWHFIALDSVQPGATPGTYSAFLDEEQLDWLKQELAAVTEKPILIWSHISIVTAMPMLKRRPTPTGDLTVNPAVCHTDAGMLVDLFSKHPNVKACLSGHLHQVDRIGIKGVDYYCNGAVCGNWWRGANDGFPEGYALVDLFDDGSQACEYVSYGWRAATPAKG